jgi:hypothetical protein
MVLWLRKPNAQLQVLQCCRVLQRVCDPSTPSWRVMVVVMSVLDLQYAFQAKSFTLMSGEAELSTVSAVVLIATVWGMSGRAERAILGHRFFISCSFSSLQPFTRCWSLGCGRPVRQAFKICCFASFQATVETKQTLGSVCQRRAHASVSCCGTCMKRLLEASNESESLIPRRAGC